MKSIKLLTAGACALAFVGMASAQTTITITGSSAYRGAVHKAIIHILNGTVNTSGSTPTATLPTAGGTGGFAYSDPSDFTKANGATFRGYIGGDSSKEVIIKTSWTGSAAGIQTVAAPVNDFKVRVLPAGTVLATGGTSSQADPTKTTSPADLLAPDLAMSDNKQSSTLFNSTLAGDGETYAPLTATKVGVVPFQFVRSKGSPASITNVTPQIARTLWTGNGQIPLSFFTGVSTDAGTIIYATGRNPDSGTRIDCFAETGIGINNVVQQYDPATGNLYPVDVVNGISVDLGQSGESSGGTLATKMGAAGLSKSYISYLSTSDAVTLVNAGGATLSYNGVAYAPDNIAVEQGSYTFWGFEYLNYRPGTTGIQLTTATALINQLLATDATIRISDMKVTRSTDGGNVTQ